MVLPLREQDGFTHAGAGCFPTPAGAGWFHPLREQGVTCVERKKGLVDMHFAVVACSHTRFSFALLPAVTRQVGITVQKARQPHAQRESSDTVLDAIHLLGAHTEPWSWVLLSSTRAQQ